MTLLEKTNLYTGLFLLTGGFCLGVLAGLAIPGATP